MNRERALKIVLALVGLLFSAGIYPLVTMIRSALQPLVLTAFVLWIASLAMRGHADQLRHRNVMSTERRLNPVITLGNPTGQQPANRPCSGRSPRLSSGPRR
jgi:hypothetical protein